MNEIKCIRCNTTDMNPHQESPVCDECYNVTTHYVGKYVRGCPDVWGQLYTNDRENRVQSMSTITNYNNEINK